MSETEDTQSSITRFYTEEDTVLYPWMFDQPNESREITETLHVGGWKQLGVSDHANLAGKTHLHFELDATTDQSDVLNLAGPKRFALSRYFPNCVCIWRTFGTKSPRAKRILSAAIATPIKTSALN